MKAKRKTGREPPRDIRLFLIGARGVVWTLAEDGLPVSIVWVRRKARGYKAQTRSDYGRLYRYQIPPVLIEGEDYILQPPRNRLLFSSQGIAKLREERKRELETIAQGIRSNRQAERLS